MDSNPSHPIVFYDGECGLCQRSVQWLLKRDKRRVLRYAPLQGETAKAHLPPALIADLSSMALVLPDGRIFTKSSAVLHSMVSMGGIYTLMGMCLVIPPGVRNLIYQWVAKRRIRFFGKADTCRLPGAGEAVLFLP